MEVGEENTSINLQESTTTATTVSNEKLLENDSINDNELGKEVTKSNTGEEKLEESSVILPKLDGPEPVAMPVGEKAEEMEAGVTFQLENPKSIECSNSVVVKSTSLLKDENQGDEGAVEDEITIAEVADVAREADGGECEAVVSVPDDGLNAAENCTEDDNTNGPVVIEHKDAVKMEEDVQLLPVAEIGEPVEAMADVKTDGAVDSQKEGNAQIVQGDEAITDGQDEVEECVNAELAEDDAKLADTQLDTVEEAITMSDEEKPGTDLPVKGRWKRKRGGKNTKATPKPAVGCRKKIEEEDVCFICFDGGDLVLCDKRDCPKAYHPSCVKRDLAFFQTKGKWNCGWHQCSVCEKKAQYMCYTCTYSLCKTCIKTNVILCVRQNEKKGFCKACMETVMSIENKSQQIQENVDTNSWEYMFKDYWTDAKTKHNLSLTELLEAKNAWKGSEPAGHSDGGSGSDHHPSDNQESQPKKTRRRKSKKHKNHDEETLISKNTKWASKQLLEFVTNMGNDTSYQSQFDVQALLLEYIKTNKLRDTKRKSQIICDARLQRLFGKPRVGHFEMLRLLESHFLIKQDDDIQGSVVDTENLVDNDDGKKIGKDKKRKISNKNDQEPQSNREDYAAIDMHNIKFIYLKRKLVEDLLNDAESFHTKVVGTFVRLKISDIYRLVQVKGTTKGEEYTAGKKMTDARLEVLNLGKMEIIPIDIISPQDFTEDECKRLRQSIKCGLLNRPKVGEIMDKAIELQAARVNDWLETEVTRLSHLRDRANDLGRKKELRECVEKLQVLEKPEERARRLQDIPLVHDQKFESEDDDAAEDDKKKVMSERSMSCGFSKRHDYPSCTSSKNYELSRKLSSNSFLNITEDPSSFDVNVGVQGRNKSPKKPDFAEDGLKVSEREKIWHYRDPSGKIEGPLSMAKLRKWNNDKFVPVDLRIWRKNLKENDGILLSDALEGQFHPKLGPHVGPSLYHGLNEGLQSPTPMVQSPHGWGSTPNIVQPNPYMGPTNWAPTQAATPNQGWVGPASPMARNGDRWHGSNNRSGFSGNGRLWGSFNRF